MIRYFANCRDTPDGLLALSYLKALLRIAPVRVLSGGGAWGASWAPYSPLLLTPMVSPYVNVVCCPPARWTWSQKISMPNLDATGAITSHEIVEGRIELYTASVRNALLTDAWPDHLHAPELATARRYEALVVPTEEIAQAWRQVQCHPTVIPVPVTVVTALGAAIIG